MRRPVVFATLLLLSGCHDDPPATKSSKSAEAARIEKEVARRVDASGQEASIRASRLHTIRAVGFIVLTGGAVAGLMWVRQPRRPELPSQAARLQPTQPPMWMDHHPPSTGRVIDFPTNPPNRRQNPNSPNRRNKP